MDDTDDLWFYRPDVQALFDHLLTHPPADPDTAMLLLYAQGRLRYLTYNSPHPQLVDPDDPDTRQRVYAVGHAAHHDGISYPVDITHGAPRLLDELRRDILEPVLADAAAGDHDWLSVLDHREETHIEPADLPRPLQPGGWKPARICLSGLPDLFDGHILDRHSHNGFRAARLDHTQTLRLHHLIEALPEPPAGTHRFDLDGPQAITTDRDGFYRFATWPWVVPAQTPPGALLPATGPNTPTACGYVYVTDSGQYWLDHDRRLACHLHADPSGGKDSYLRGRRVPDRRLQQARAIEHQLLLAPPLPGYLAGHFTSAEVDTLIATAAEVIHSGLSDLTERQLALAARADELRNGC